MNYERLKSALELLGIQKTATLAEIKEVYHQKINKYHPDKNKEESNADVKTAELIEAYDVIQKYCQNYSFNFNEEEYRKQSPSSFEKDTNSEYAEWWQKTYGSDIAWGKGDL